MKNEEKKNEEVKVRKKGHINYYKLRIALLVENTGMFVIVLDPLTKLGIFTGRL